MATNAVASLHRPHCPVCGGANAEIIWQIPFTRLDEDIAVCNARVRFLPCVAENATVTVWHQCDRCLAVFISPIFEPLAHDRRHYIDKMQQPHNWAGYRRRVDWFWPKIPPLEPADRAPVVIDAACGIGQYLVLLRDRLPAQSRLIGLEHNQVYCDWMAGQGLDARQVDLCESDQEALEPLESAADLIVFSEAFEHMLDAGAAMGNLVRMLAPGGCLFYTAQAFDGLPIRPEETIYARQFTLSALHRLLGVALVSQSMYAGRFWSLVRKEPK